MVFFFVQVKVRLFFRFAYYENFCIFAPVNCEEANLMNQGGGYVA